MKGVLAGDFDLGEFGEDPDEVLPRVKLPPAAALDDGEPDGVGLPCLGTAHEEPVLSCDKSAVSRWRNKKETPSRHDRGKTGHPNYASLTGLCLELKCIPTLTRSAGSDWANEAQPFGSL